MIREKPIRLPEWTNASVTEPDWAIPATPPRGRYGETSPMYVGAVRGQVDDAHAVRADQREAVLAGDPRDLELHRGGRLAALDDAAAGDDDRRDAGRGGRRRDRARHATG